MKNQNDDFFVVIVEIEKISLWEKYNKEEEQIFVNWIQKNLLPKGSTPKFALYRLKKK